MSPLTRLNPATLSKIKQGFIAASLLILLIVSRADYLHYLQDATWAVLFILGFYIRSYFGLSLFLLAIIFFDFAQIAARGGHQDFYLAPSYLFIIPAYCALWFAGRFAASHYSENIKGLILFFISAIVGIIMCHLISSGGYYWISMKFIELNYRDLISRILAYLPLALKINLTYLSTIAMIHLIFIKICSRKLSTRS